MTKTYRKRLERRYEKINSLINDLEDERERIGCKLFPATQPKEGTPEWYHMKKMIEMLTQPNPWTSAISGGTLPNISATIR